MFKKTSARLVGRDIKHYHRSLISTNSISEDGDTGYAYVEGIYLGYGPILFPYKGNNNELKKFIKYFEANRIKKLYIYRCKTTFYLLKTDKKSTVGVSEDAEKISYSEESFAKQNNHKTKNVVRYDEHNGATGCSLFCNCLRSRFRENLGQIGKYTIVRGINKLKTMRFTVSTNKRVQFNFESINALSDWSYGSSLFFFIGVYILPIAHKFTGKNVFLDAEN